MFKQINSTTINLIPKSAHAPTVQEYISISCCNILYKIISKVVSARLKPVLSGIISKAWAAFVEGRCIGDNIMMCQELLYGYERKGFSPRCSIKVDLHKACDSVHWRAIEEIMLALDFDDRFVCWVMLCASSTFFSYVVNGCLECFFDGKRGLGQGDPLSPYILLLWRIWLARGLNKICKDPNFSFHPRCRGLSWCICVLQMI